MLFIGLKVSIVTDDKISFSSDIIKDWVQSILLIMTLFSSSCPGFKIVSLCSACCYIEVMVNNIILIPIMSC